jgi:hypothetical protein
MSQTIDDVRHRIKRLKELETDMKIGDMDCAFMLEQYDAKVKEIEDIKKTLSEVSHCKIGNLVVYNPNGEDKDAKFVAKLVHDTQAESDTLKAQNEKLIKALSFYADNNNWKHDYSLNLKGQINSSDWELYSTPVTSLEIGGKLARQVLKELGHE